MAYPPSIPPATRTDSTVTAGNHASDHNALASGMAALVAELGSDPSGPDADVAARVARIDAAVSNLRPANVKNPLTGWIHADLFGAKGDGITDDTAAIQAAINAAIGGTPAGGATSVRSAIAPVYLNIQGTYKITAPLLIRSVQGFHLKGTGEETFIAVSGALASAIDVNGSHFGTFEDFTIKGSTVADSVATAFKMDWDPAVAQRSNTGNTLRNILLRNLIYTVGFGIGNNSAGRQVDNTAYYHCAAEGAWASGNTTTYQAAFRIGSGTFGNILNHFFYGCSASGHRYNYYIDSLTGFGVFGGSVGNAEVDFRLGLGGAAHISTVRSEVSQRFIDTPASGAATFLTITDCQIMDGAAAADGELIRWGYGGALIIDNLSVAFNLPFKIKCVGNASKVANVHVRGGGTSAAGPALVASGGAAAPFVAYLTGYSQVIAGEVARSWANLTYDRTRTLTPAGVPSSTDGATWQDVTGATV